MTAEILVIHNAVDKVNPAKGRAVFVESNAGVIEEVCAVTEAIEKLGMKYEVKSIETIKQLPDIFVHSNQRIVFNLVEELADNILHACYVPAICHSYGRTCTGSETPALLLAQNKWQAKAVLKAANVPSPQSVLVPTGQKINPKALSAGKYVVKPVFSDASEGIDADSFVDVPGAALHKAIRRVHTQFNQPAIVERFIPHRELTVSLLERNGHVQVLPPAEIDFGAFGPDELRIVDYSAKWQEDSFAYNNTPRIIPSPLSEETTALLQQYALSAWNAIGCQDYARVDFRMDDNEQLFVLEINPNPAISPEDGMVAALASVGISYEKFIETLLNNASERSSSETVF